MIRAIFFDAAGILYTRREHTEEYVLALLHEKGFHYALTASQYEHLSDLKSLANEGEIGYEAYWEQFLLMRNVQDPQERQNITHQIITYSNDVQPVPGARETLAQLKRRGFRLGIITDTMYPVEWKMRRMEKVGVAEFIDIVACSTVLGAHKPDPVVYSYALHQAGVEPHEAIFVGHLGIELDGAHQAKMITVAIYYDPGSKADYYCDSITELINLPILQKGSDK